MSIEARGGQWYYRFMFQGREYRKTTGLAATRENKIAAKAQERTKRAELQLRRGAPEPAPAIAFTEAAYQFLDWCQDVEYRGQRSTFLRINTSLASAVNFWKDFPVSSIDAEQIEAYRAFRAKEHQVREITIRHDLYALSVFFKRFCVKRGWAKANPVAEVSMPSDKDAVRIHVLTADEEAAYFQEAAKNPNLHDLAKLMIEQGCRPEELLALRSVDVDLTRNKLQIRGGKSRAARRSLELTSVSAAILARRQRADPDWIFPSVRRAGQHIVKLNNAHDQACIDAGVSFVMYDLRHTFATRMLVDVGVDLATVAALLGHSGLRAVTKYLHPQEQSKVDAMRRYEVSRKGEGLRLVKGNH